MKTEYPRSFYLRILLVSLVIALLGLAPIPHSVSQLFAKAYLAQSQGDALSASLHLGEVANYYPWRYELNLQAARYAMVAGDPQAAITYLERPGTVSHLTIDDTLLLGDAYDQRGDVYMAEAIWKRVSQLADSAPANERLANLYLQRQDYASAIAALQKLHRLNPSDTHLYYQIGSLFAATEPTQALPYLAQAVEVDPSKTSQAQGLYDKIRTANLFDNPAYTLLISGRQLANLSEWELASVAFQQATHLQPEYADAWAFLGEARQQVIIQKIGAAGGVGLTELEHSLKLDPRSILANTFMGLYWERQQDYSKAQYYLEQAIMNNPSDPYLYSELANILSKAGDLPAAETRYAEA
ncbi:MAG TPA: tetratricopeptide repeat protein, partial [Anaerolineales bacterium]